MKIPQARGRNGTFTPVEISRSPRWQDRSTYRIEVTSKEAGQRAPIIQLTISERQRDLLIKMLQHSPGRMVILNLEKGEVHDF